MPKYEKRPVETGIPLSVIVGFFLVMALMLAWGGYIVYATIKARPVIGTHAEVFPDLLPGELVDKAMGVPGAIVISPHRDLVEMGIISGDPTHPDAKSYFCSPAIAVHTKKNWCIWELGGMECTFSYDSHGWTDKISLDANHMGGSTSFRGYQFAYDAFVKCVSEGNKVAPVKDAGDKCSDTRKLNMAVLKAVGASGGASGGADTQDGCGTSEALSE